MNRADALKKIRKCLAVAGSNSPEEAANALRQAQKLMGEHGISEGDLALSEVGEVSVKSACNGVSSWELMLAEVVAECFGCRLLAGRRLLVGAGGRLRRQTSYIFIGAQGAESIAGYAFEVLSRQCAQARRDYIDRQSKNCKRSTKTGRGDEFAKGWVTGVAVKVAHFSGTREKAHLLLQYEAEKYPALSEFKPRQSHTLKKVSIDHRFAGILAARDACLSKPLSGRSQVLALT